LETYLSPRHHLLVTQYFVARRPAAVKSPSPNGRRAARTWSEHEIVDAIRRWIAEHGAPPTCLDWDPARARRKGHPERAARFEAGRWPTTKIVADSFGTFNAAMHAAGIRPRRSGGNKGNLAGPEAILDAIRVWTIRYGDPPRRTDWDPTRARQTRQPWKVERYELGDWPSLPSVAHHFGGLTMAITASGLEPAPQYESPDERAERRRRNRLALVGRLADGTPLDGRQLDTVMAELAVARDTKDPDVVEEALLRLAACALGLADVVQRRRNLIRPAP